MTFDFAIRIQAPSPLPPPAWCANIAVDVKPANHEILPENESIEPESISIEGKFKDLIIWPQSWQPLYPGVISKAGSQLLVRVPLTREIVQAIETKRAGNGPLLIDIQLVFCFRRIRQQGPAYDAPTFAAKSETSNQTLRWEIHRDPWRECLKQLGWNEIEIFELPMGPLWRDQNLAHALDSLHSAEHLLHFGGDPKAVLGKCYDALESAAKYAVRGDDKRKGFEVLLERAFPGEADKATHLNAMIGALNQLAHIGRHAEYPKRHVSWAEARFGLVSTLAILEVLTTNGP